MPITVPRPDSSRLELRMPTALKDEVEEAASLLGVTTTAFVTQAVTERAREVKRDYSVTVLSGEDREAFLEMMSNPPEPSDALRRTLATRADV